MKGAQVVWYSNLPSLILTLFAIAHSQHTAGLNISGSFLLGVIYAMPTVDVNKVNQIQSGMAKNPLERFQGLTPRAKLMLGVGYDDKA